MSDDHSSLSAPVNVPHGVPAEGDEHPRHFVSWTCLRVDPAWRRLPARERREQVDELAAVLDAWGERIVLRTFSTVGLRPDCELVTWRATPELELLQESHADLLATALGSWLETTHLYTATTKRSQYEQAAAEAGFRRRRPLDVVPVDRRYLVMYPFVKRRDWYALPAAERGRMMREHAEIGRRWPGIKLNTAYSFGLDDQEFMTAFETDSVHDFLDLMMALRHSEASQYTERDTPIFTCIHMPAREALKTLAGLRASSIVPNVVA